VYFIDRQWKCVDNWWESWDERMRIIDLIKAEYQESWGIIWGKFIY
jgi:hypothetical protein